MTPADKVGEGETPRLITRLHTCVISQSVLEKWRNEGGEHSLDLIGKFPDNVVSTRTVVPLHTRADGSLCQVIEIKQRADLPERNP